jgi:Recombinase zinc beta ribbon domain/Recombinase
MEPLRISRLHDMLTNPVYAGVYAYGRRREKKVLMDGQIRRMRPDTRDPERWVVRIEGAHPGYITWERYVQNQEKPRQNMTRMGPPSRGAPREGPALLSGLLLCGRCGRRMGPRYARGARARFWTYACPGDRDRGQKGCWTVAGARIDAAVEQLFLETMVPSELELALAVEQEVAGQAEELAQQWRARREQATYEARRAEKRYKAVDPDNRVVARTLEREWESKLRELEEVEQQYAEARRTKRVELSAADRARVRELARDLPAVWRSPVTPPADRKAMLRLVIEAISLAPIEVPRRTTAVKVAWQSGTVTEIEVPRPSRRQLFRTPLAAVEQLGDRAAAGRHDEEIATILNAEGCRTGRGQLWTMWAVRWISRVAPDRPRRELLPDRYPDGRYSVAGAAKRFGVTLDVIRAWIKRGLLLAGRAPGGPEIQEDDGGAMLLERHRPSRQTGDGEVRRARGLARPHEAEVCKASADAALGPTASRAATTSAVSVISAWRRRWCGRSGRRPGSGRSEGPVPEPPYPESPRAYPAPRVPPPPGAPGGDGR